LEGLLCARNWPDTDLYLTILIIDIQVPAGFKPAISASKQPQTHTSDHVPPGEAQAMITNVI